MKNKFQLSRLLKVSEEKNLVVSLNNRTDGYTFEQMKLLMKMNEKTSISYQLDIGLYSVFETNIKEVSIITVQLAKDFETAMTGNSLKSVLYANMIRVDTVTYEGNMHEYKTLMNIPCITNVWQTIRIKFTLFYDNMPRRDDGFIIRDVMEKIIITKIRQLPYNSPLRPMLKKNFTITEEEKLLLLYGLITASSNFNIRTFRFQVNGCQPECTTDWVEC